jgi:hypothetical protein
MAPLVLAFVVAISATFIAARLFLPTPLEIAAQSPPPTQPAPSGPSGDESPGLARVAHLVDLVADITWGAMVEASGDDTDTFGFGPRTFFEDWQEQGVPEGAPLHLSLSFEGGEGTMMLTTIFEGAVLGAIERGTTVVVLRLPDNTYAAREGECEVELVELEYHLNRGQHHAVRGQDIFLPTFSGWFDCVDVPNRDGTASLSFRGAFAYRFM